MKQSGESDAEGSPKWLSSNDFFIGIESEVTP
jgi:hypothetical protein